MEEKPPADNEFQIPLILSAQSSSNPQILPRVESLSEQMSSKPSSDSLRNDERMEESKQNPSDQGAGAQTNKLDSPNKSGKPAPKKLCMDDFEYVRNLGKGAFGEVVLVKKKSDEKLYAMKAIDKNFLSKEKKQYQVYIEKEVLMRLNHPNLPKLYYSFQDKFKLYFVMEFCENGEFSDFLRINKKLDFKIIQFYAGEIVNILEYLHNNGVAHRDLKPENLMLGSNNHMKIIDFGTAYFFKSVAGDLLKIINNIRKAEMGDQDAYVDYQNKHKATFVGTAEYVAPELLEDGECAAPADLWALGCIIYRMFVGSTPFYDSTEYLMFNKIKKGDYSMHPEIPLPAQDLIRNLLKRNPRARLGAGAPGEPNDFKALKAHPFFEGLDFENLNKSPAPHLNVIKPFPDSDDFEFDNLNPYKIKKITERENNQNNSMIHLKEGSGNPGNIVLTGLAMRKVGWLFYEPILLVLKDNKQLSYYDPETNKLKGDIDLSSEVQCDLIYKTKFSLILPTRKFYFKEIENPASLWVDMIKKVIDMDKF